MLRCRCRVIRFVLVRISQTFPELSMMVYLGLWEITSIVYLNSYLLMRRGSRKFNSFTYSHWARLGWYQWLNSLEFVLTWYLETRVCKTIALSNNALCEQSQRWAAYNVCLTLLTMNLSLRQTVSSVCNVCDALLRWQCIWICAKSRQVWLY